MSRCLVSVLDTMDHLFDSYRMVVTNLDVNNLFLRKGNESGYLGKLDVHQAHPIRVSTNSFPYYFEAQETENVRIGDTFAGVIVMYSYFTNPEAWQFLLGKQKKQKTLNQL